MGNTVVVISADQRHFSDPSGNQKGRKIPAGAPVVIVHAENRSVRGWPDDHKGHLLFLQKAHHQRIHQAAHGNDTVDLSIIDQPGDMLHRFFTVHDHQHVIAIIGRDLAHAPQAFPEERFIQHPHIVRHHQPDIVGLILCQALCHRIGTVTALVDEGKNSGSRLRT